MSDPKRVEKPEVRPDWLFGGDPNAIEAQEADGQKSLMQSSQLPVEGSPGHYMYGREDPKSDEAWSVTGIEFGPVEEGELFRNAMLPAGWKKVPTDHAMWSHLVDDKGRVRASIFYKAAFYDQKAHMDLNHRFVVKKIYDRTKGIWDAYDLMWEVTDCGEQVFKSKAYPIPENPRGKGDEDAWEKEWKPTFEAAQEAAKEECKAWLKENGFEDWENPGAYWS